MKLQAVLVALCCTSHDALRPTLTTQRRAQLRGGLSMQYVPDGMTAAQYNALKSKEKKASTNKNFGRGGARGFESRSMNSFVKALENGEAEHLMPVNPDDVRKGKIKLKDVPYMQRGGSWTNNDLLGKKGWQTTGFGMKALNDGKAEKMKTNKWDKLYNAKKPTNSILGMGAGLDWTGKGASGDSIAARAKKNGLNADQQMWRDSGALSQAEIQRMNKQRDRKKNMFGGGPKIQGGRAGAAPPAPEKKKFFGLF